MYDQEEVCFSAVSVLELAEFIRKDVCKRQRKPSYTPMATASLSWPTSKHIASPNAASNAPHSHTAQMNSWSSSCSLPTVHDIDFSPVMDDEEVFVATAAARPRSATCVKKPSSKSIETPTTNALNLFSDLRPSVYSKSKNPFPTTSIMSNIELHYSTDMRPKTPALPKLCKPPACRKPSRRRLPNIGLTAIHE